MKKLLVPLLVLAFLQPGVSPAVADEPEPELSTRPRWQQLFPPVSPPGRTEHTMAFDTARMKGVLFGGYDDGVYLNDTWEWDSATMSWSERQPAHRPPARYGAAMVYDQARGVSMLFGGVAGFTYYDDTWLWDGTDWTQVFPTNAPLGRWLHAMVYDTGRQRVVLFGGLGDGIYDDTWEWDGSNWMEQAIARPSDRFGSGMAYDARRGVTVLFGGDEGLGFDFLEDTWERAGGGNWVEVFPERHPRDRARMAAAYFPELRRVVIFGGLSPNRILDDTWFWNGQNWRKKSFDPRPGGFNPLMVYDACLKGVFYFDGSAETWLLR